MIYRVSFSTDEDGHEGYRYFTNRRTAERAAAEWCKDRGADDDGPAQLALGSIEASIEGAVKTPKTTAEWISLLNRWGSHNDNG